MNTLCLSFLKVQNFSQSGNPYTWVSKQAILHCLVHQSLEYLPFDTPFSFSGCTNTTTRMPQNEWTCLGKRHQMTYTRIHCSYHLKIENQEIVTPYLSFPFLTWSQMESLRAKTLIFCLSPRAGVWGMSEICHLMCFLCMIQNMPSVFFRLDMSKCIMMLTKPEFCYYSQIKRSQSSHIRLVYKLVIYFSLQPLCYPCLDTR